jgi:hypothetical protein
MHSPYLAATLAATMTRDRIEAATAHAAASRAVREPGSGRSRGLFTELIVNQLMRQSLNGARADDPVLPARAQRSSRGSWRLPRRPARAVAPAVPIARAPVRESC